MATTRYDYVILGSGQSGTPLAAALATAGQKTALVEPAHLGGTCVNEGCTPTKTMIASGRIAYLAGRAGDYGVHLQPSMAGEGAGAASPVPQTDMAAVRQRKRDIVASWSKGSEERLVSAGVEILKGSARFVGPKELKVALCSGGEEKHVQGDVVVINTGERPARPHIPGLDDVAPDKVLDSTTVMELGEVPGHLVVVGGGYVGLEFAQLFRRFGAEVAVVQRGKQLLPREDADVAAAMLEILKGDGITVHLSANVASASPGRSGVDIDVHVRVSGASGEGEEEELTVEGTHLLLAAGRTPNTDTLELAAAGVATGRRGHVLVNEGLETNVPGIFATGDVHGPPAFTHISFDDFRVLRARLLPETVPTTTPPMATTKASVSRGLTPYVVYTDPQLGHVGLHAKDFEGEGDGEANRKVKTATMPMAYVARAIETAETRGLMKATVDASTGEILGFTCLGVEGGEVMAVVQTAMMGGLKWWDLEAAVWAHPSLAESLNNLWRYFEE